MCEFKPFRSLLKAAKAAKAALVLDGLSTLASLLEAISVLVSCAVGEEVAL
jgi:hypothetical protein